jgi:misacylated tRNA(Ala) deacylase
VTTEQIFQFDSYVRRFQACVAKIEATELALDRTAFYPAGGGQPCDIGTMETSAGVLAVTSVRRHDGLILHDVNGDQLPKPGEMVVGNLDWDHRYSLMRIHTALHILCGVVFREYGALVTGGKMYPGQAHMDFELDELKSERVARIERLSNLAIEQSRPVVVRLLPREEAFGIPDLIRTKINLLPVDIAEVRTVEIVGLDLQADGGTHVANTREVGGLEIVGTRNKGRTFKRVEIQLLDSPLLR